jgi:molybdate transport repressor ModE-like protein
MMVSMDAYDISTRQLEALQSVVREGSFAKAAAYLGFSQAAISQQIARLEACIGLPVLERPGGRRAATITQAGRMLLAHADLIVHRVGMLEADLEQLRAGTGGRISCGVFQSVGVQFLPDIVRRVRAESPDLEVSLIERDTNDELIEPLMSGELDVAFITGPLEDPRLELIDLGTDPFVLLLPQGSPLAPSGKNAFSVEQLRGVPLIGQQECTCQTQIDDGLRASGIAPRYLFRTNDNGAVQAMVRSGIAPAVMPALAVDWDDPEVTVWDVAEIEPRTIILALPRNAHRLPAVERFVTIARSVSAARLAAHGKVRRSSASKAAPATRSKSRLVAASSATT